MNIHHILKRIDELSGPAGLSDRAVSMRATGSTDLVRNWRRAALDGKPAAPNLQTLERVAQALGTTLDDLLADEPSAAKREIVRLSDLLSEEHLQKLEGYARALLDTQGQSSPESSSTD